MKLVEQDSTAKVGSCEGSPVEVGDLTEGGLAERLCRIVRDEDSVRSLHALLGPFCHQSRNLLNSLKLGFYLARQQEDRQGSGAGDWEELERGYQQVEQLFDRLQSICRPLELTRVRLALSLLLNDRRNTWATYFSSHGRVLEMVAPRREEVGEYDPNWLGQALDAFVRWRADQSGSGREARIRWWTEQGQFQVQWVETETKTEAQVETERDTDSGAGAGSTRLAAPNEPLALPLLGRVISAHGGALEQVEPAGRHIRMSWPLTARLS